MSVRSAERHNHWEGVYRDRPPTKVSWFQHRPNLSLDLIDRTGLTHAARILDVGGGASTLVDHLLNAGWTALSVLDISETALALARQRLGERAIRVTWIAADITSWQPELEIDLWHDRAVLHFLTDAGDQKAYADTARRALQHEGWMVIAGFAPGGPRKCSGLDVVQHDAASLGNLLGDQFELVDWKDESHCTPAGSLQEFRYHLFRRR